MPAEYPWKVIDLTGFLRCHIVTRHKGSGSSQSSIELYRISAPERCFALVSNGHALLLRHVQAVARPQVAISFTKLDLIDLTLNAKRIAYIHGCLGLLHSGQDVFLAVVDHATSVGSQVQQDVISRISAVTFHCLSSHAWDSRNPQESLDDPSMAPMLEFPCAGIAKILTNGNFYFSNIDLSTRTEVRARRGNNDASEYDGRFLWNAFMLDSCLGFRSALTPTERGHFDQAGFLLMIIQGYVGVSDLNMGGISGPATVTLSVISRLGSKRAGTRFNARGIDDDGNVANYVETETILRTQTMCFSHVQIRGSIPLFWEQQGLQPFGSKLVITRPAIASQPAFEAHLRDLLTEYDKVHIMNLLGTRDHEALLTQTYENHLRQAINSDPFFRRGAEMTNFDFHARARMGGIESIGEQMKDEKRISNTSENFGYCVVAISDKGEFEHLVSTQAGLFRTNCLDCLDRTNVIQDYFSRMAVEHFLKNAYPAWSGQDHFWSRHAILWAENGDALAKIYAGTGALNTSFTRSGRKTLAGVLSDASKSVGRMYHSNFADTGKQQAIDELLGNMSGQMKVAVFDPVHDEMEEQLKSRASEYSSFSNATIWVGTYNLNGKAPSESLAPWLFPKTDIEPDVFAIGFQEIVQLNAGQIINADPEKKRKWEAHITQQLMSRGSEKSQYVILRSEQLVGTALFVIVKTSQLNNVRNVEAATKKTGLKGMAGNKGGIAIRFDYKDTSFCFLTAHFAAGSSNIEERDGDYRTISNGMLFRRGLAVGNHDNVVWLGDFNYRTSMLTTEEARQLATGDDYTSLLQFDQLTASLSGGSAFQGFTEAPVTFRPTYKYDVGSDTFDSSEKQRVPSWTDRVLYKGVDLDVTKYDSADLRLSDHRPVYALMRARIKTVDKEARGKIAESILKKIRISTPIDDANKSLLMSMQRSASANGMPLPSSETSQWYATEDSPDGVVRDATKWRTGAVNPFEPIKRKPVLSPTIP